MNPTTVIMGLADLICVGLILYAFGLNVFTGVLGLIMVSKGITSFA